MAFEGNPTLVRAFKITDATGVAKCLAVVQGTNEYECALPGGANAAKCLGFTLDAQANQNHDVPVAMEGIALATAKSAISVGDECVINDTDGKVKTRATTGTVIQEVVCQALQAAADDGDVLEVLITRKAVRPALT